MWALPACAQALAPVEAYASHPRYSAASLSPDGDRLAVAIPEDGGDRLAVISLSDPEDRKGYKFARAVITELKWYGNEAVTVQVYGRFSTVPQTSLRTYIAYPTTDDSPKFVEYLPPVTAREGGGGRSFVWSLYQIVDLVPEEEDYFLMAAYVNRQPGMQQFGSSTPNIWGYDLLRTYVDNGQARALEQGTRTTGQWFTDGHGNIVARVEVLDSGRQVIGVPDGSDYREIASLDDATGNGGDIVGLSLDGTAIVVRAQRAQRIGLYPISLSDGSWGDAIYYNDAFDVGGILYDERTFRVNGIVYQQNLLTRYIYFDPEMQMLQEALEGAFADQSIEIISRSEDGNKVLFEISSPTRPSVLGIFNKEALSVDTISESYPDLLSTPFGEVSRVSYTTTDGSELTGILTLPPGVAPQNLPLVVLEDTAIAPTFDVFAQFLASRGYATFRPGIRSLRRIGDVSGMDELNDWVLSMQEDYSTGVQQLVSNGTVDPTRVCIFGDNEQGYTALMNAVVSDDVYKCVITTSPLTDLKRLVNWARFASQLSLLSFNSPLVRNYDHYSEDDLESLSPVARAADVNAAVLLAGFEEDSHVPAMEAALRRAGKQVEFVEFDAGYNEPADGRAENAILSYTAIERFLSEQLGQ